MITKNNFSHATHYASGPAAWRALAILGLGVLAGCASTPKDSPEVSQARAALASAESAPAVAQYAAVELDNSRKYMGQADAAAKAHEKPEVVNHYAYLTKQMAMIATEHAKAKQAEMQLAQGDEKRTKIQLAARESEVARARNEAANARSSAQAAEQRANQSDEERQRLQEESQRMAQELAQMKATPTPRGIVLTLGDVLFDTGKAEMKSGATRTLDRLNEFLKEHSERKVQIEGFTDARGGDDYNLALSERRANAVRDALVTRGVDSGRITSKGYGKAFPVASNAEAAGRQLNRRVEVIISNDAGDIPSR